MSINIIKTSQNIEPKPTCVDFAILTANHGNLIWEATRDQNQSFRNLMGNPNVAKITCGNCSELASEGEWFQDKDIKPLLKNSKNLLGKEWTWNYVSGVPKSSNTQSSDDRQYFENDDLNKAHEVYTVSLDENFLNKLASKTAKTLSGLKAIFDKTTTSGTYNPQDFPLDMDGDGLNEYVIGYSPQQNRVVVIEEGQDCFSHGD